MTQPKVIRTTKGREFDFLLVNVFEDMIEDSEKIVKVHILSAQSFYQKLRNLTLKTETLVNIFVHFFFLLTKMQYQIM